MMMASLFSEIAHFFLFEETPSISLSFFRVLVGFLMLSEAWQWYFSNQNFVSANGFFDIETFKKTKAQSHFTLLNFLPKNDGSVKLIIGLQATFAVFMILGIFPQLAAFFCFLATVSLINRNPEIFDASDHIRRFFCFFMIFANTGSQLSVLSVDDFWQLERQTWPWLLFLIQFFMAHIYFKNVLFKLFGKAWHNGTATEHVFHVNIWNRFELPQILQKKWFYRLSTYGTLIIETALFTLIWVEGLHIWVVGIGILFHLLLGLFLRIGFFQATMIVGLSVFIPPQYLVEFLNWAFY